MGPSGPDDRASQPRYSLLASRWVRLAWPEIPPRDAPVPARLIGAVALELGARRRRRAVVRVLATTCASAAAIAAGIVAWTWMEHGLPVALRDRFDSPSGKAARIDPVDQALWANSNSTAARRRVVAGDMFRAAADELGVRLDSSDGTEMLVEPGGTLQIVEAGTTRRFTLLHGAVRVHVHKLQAGERFLIDTSEAEIEVHGTRFRVTRAEPGVGSPSTCAGAPSTGVSVSEGVVSVSGAGTEARLLPGSTWTSPCPASSQPVAALSPSNAAPRPEGTGMQWSRRRRQMSASSASQLAAENDLFAAAARARKQGHGPQALALFERFIARYPDSSLFESALVQRMRLLGSGTAPVGAAETAADYLRRFPDGFARVEAERLIASPAGLSRPAASPARAR